MAKRIRKWTRPPEDRPAALGELIHTQVRLAIETAVHEELAIALGAGRYEPSMDISNPAIRGRAKTGHRASAQAECVVTRSLLKEQAA
jgi:hypothetical protein